MSNDITVSKFWTIILFAKTFAQTKNKKLTTEAETERFVLSKLEKHIINKINSFTFKKLKIIIY